MKKIFTLITLAVMAISSYAADITIYVKADAAPYLYTWGGADNGGWPGTQMTETATVQGTTFWKKTFTITAALNIIFNDGAGNQTGNITGLTTDRYFTYDGAKSYTDITEQYTDVPDADITSVSLAGPFNGWDATASGFAFTEVAHNAKYTYVWDLTGVSDPTFKVVINNNDWLGYWDFGDAQENLDAPAGWVQEGADSGNMMFDTSAMGGVTKVLFTATWTVGKSAAKDWKLKVEDAASSGIGTITTTTTANGAIYNLAGQKVGKDYKGIVIQNGRKFVQK